MTVAALKELLADVPDHWEVGVEVCDGDDTDVVSFEGKSDTRWTHCLALLTEAPKKRVTLQ